MEDNILEKMPIGPLFFRMTIPAVLSQMINILYNLVDKMFIGRIPGEGAKALAGLGVTTPVILFLSAFAALVSMGGAPKAAIALGKNEKNLAERIMGSCVAMLLLMSVVLTIVMLIWGENILLIFGASKNTIKYAVEYMNIYCLGTVFIQIALGLNTFISTQGFTKISMINVGIGAVINIALDPILIFTFDMGVKGAALASIIAQGVSTLFALNFLFGKKSILKIRKRYLKLDKKIVGSILALGIAPFIMQATESLVLVSLNN